MYIPEFEPKRINLGSFFAELKRRHVYRVAVGYGIVAWLLTQVATQVFPFFDVPNWTVRLVVVLLGLGLPVAMILAWAFELTPEGIKRDQNVAPNEHAATFHAAGKFVRIVLLTGASSHRPQVLVAAVRNNGQVALREVQLDSNESYRRFELALAYIVRRERSKADAAPAELIGKDRNVLAYQIADVSAYSFILLNF